MSVSLDMLANNWLDEFFTCIKLRKHARIGEMFAQKAFWRDIASKVGRCWGLGSGTKYDPGPWEGELRNMWKPTSQDGLWFHGGGLTQSRLYSRYLAIQLKARLENISTQFYGVHGAINI